MTSLQKQLAAIAATSSHELDSKAQKTAHSHSLLFEPKIAATQSFDTIYQLCVEGFEELCNIDTRFSRFASNIFSIHSKKEDREQMTARENQELNSVIESFLGLVGSRLLLRPALKSVEWIIRRFRAQQYNTAYLILTFLPYHDTPIFLTLLSILPKRLPPTYKFLHPYMNILSSPPRAALTHAATNNMPFITALSSYVLGVSKVKYDYHILVAFWASLVAQSIDGRISASMSGRKGLQQDQEENILLQILSILNDALVLRHNAELILGCYMIVTVLVSKADINERVLDAILMEVVTSWNTDTIEAGLHCASIIVTQRQTLVLPKAVFKTISKRTSLHNYFAKTAESAEMQSIALSLTLSAMEHQDLTNTFDWQTLAEQLLASKHLTDTFKDILIEGVFRSAITHSSISHDRLLSAVQSVPQAKEIGIRVLKDDRKYREVMNGFLLDADTQSEKVESENDVVLQDQLAIDSRQMTGLIDLSQFQDAGKDSFLHLAEPRTFAALQLAFQKSLSSGAQAAFVEVGRLQRHEFSTNPTYLSFFMRLSGENKSTSVRRTALHILSSEIGTSTQGLDFQSAIPYIMIALSDSATAVRKVAADMMISFSKMYQPLSEQKTVPAYESIWASQSLYGESTKLIPWLSPRDAYAFIRAISTELEECITDAHHFGLLLQQILDSSSKTYGPKFEGVGSLKSVQKAAIFTFLSEHLKYTASRTVKYKLLCLLNHVEKAGGQSRSKQLLPILKGWLSEQASDTSRYQSTLEDVEYMRIIQANDSEAVDVLLSIARAEAGLHNLKVQKIAFQRLSHLWPSMKSPMQKSVAEALLQMSTSQAHSPSTAEAATVLQSIHLPSNIVVGIIKESLADFSSNGQHASAKRRKIDNGDVIHVGKSEEDQHHKLALARLTVVLDLLHSSRPQADLDLFQGLFSILEILQSLRKYSLSDSAYLQTVTLDILSPMVSVLTSKTPDAIQHAQLLVDIVRNTANVQARNSALLLLSSLAKHDPTVVLHSVMPIFTLMSTTTMRQSDDFSAHVVDQTIQTVIPLLAESLRMQKRDLVSATAEILLNFAAAFEHIPSPRKLRLYGLLATSLGPAESLFAIVATLVDRFPESEEVRRFTLELLKPFPALVNLETVRKYIDLALDSFEARPALFQLLVKNSLNENRGEGLKAIFGTIAVLLRGNALSVKIASDLRAANDTPGAIRTLFAGLLERIIKLIKLAVDDTMSRAMSAPLLEALLELLPFDQFALSVEPLLEDADEELAQSIIKSLEVRIKACPISDKTAGRAVMQLLPRLTHILEYSQRSLLKQNAISCIDQGISKYGKTNISATLATATVIARSHFTASPDRLLPVLSLHCLASMVEILGNDFIALVKQSFDIALDALQRSLDTNPVDQKLHNAALALLMGVVERLPYAVSQNSLQQLIVLSSRSAIATIRPESKENMTQMLRLVARCVDLKVIVEVVKSVWQTCIEQGYQAVQEVLAMLKNAIEAQPKSSVSRHARTIFEYFGQAFDLRRTCTIAVTKTKYSDEQIDSIERQMIETLIATVFKVNDTMFRPFFIRLLDQCVPQQSKQAESPTLQSITFFRFVASLSLRLQSIFTNYFGLMLDQISTILATHAGKGVTVRVLQTSVLEAVSNSFKFDQDDFWQAPSHFNAILPQLLSQLSYQPLAFAQSTVIPAVTELAIAASSADNMKSMNAGLLNLMKADSARERLAGVRCEISLTEKLGEDWLSMLPEMLPVINELQDDDDERVEKETHKWIKMIEGVLGENLDAMLQ